MIKGKVTAESTGVLKRVGEIALSEVKRILVRESLLMTGYTRKTWMSGPRPEKLGVRTGNMRASTKPAPVVEVKGVGVEAGMQFGSKYARTHVGPKGQVTVIRPVSSKWLTIPLPAAMTRSGVTKGSARSGAWGETFVARSKAGNLILFGKTVAQKGKQAGQATGGIVPLFLLRKEVRIRSRVHPEVILAWEKPRLIRAFREIGVRLRG